MTHDSLWWLHEGNRALRVGDWKIVAAGKDSPWELYDLEADRAETKNLAAEKPEKVRELAAMWDKQTEECFALARRTSRSPRSNPVRQPRPERIEALMNTLARSPLPHRRSLAIGLHLLLFSAVSFASDTPTTRPAPYPGWRHSGSIYLLAGPKARPWTPLRSWKDSPSSSGCTRTSSTSRRRRRTAKTSASPRPTGEPLGLPDRGVGRRPAARERLGARPEDQGQRAAGDQAALGQGRRRRANPSGKAVFNESNGYLSVWHMSGPVRDEVGTLESKDAGTTAAAGSHRTGAALRRASRASSAATRSRTIRPAATSHSTRGVVPGREAERDDPRLGQRGGRARQQGADAVPQPAARPHRQRFLRRERTRARCRMGEWVHVVHTYDARGRQDLHQRPARRRRPSRRSNIKSPARLWIGGWYNNYDFVGDIDEVRISKVARSADWVRLEYENQKPLQTLVGPGGATGRCVLGFAGGGRRWRRARASRFTAQAGGRRRCTGS